jgi:PIN domain nuclease of toxin-antitoxin system
LKLLLDTAVVLWISHDTSKLTPAANAAYFSPDNELFVSVVSLWEIIVKNRLGKLPLPVPAGQFLDPLKSSGAIHMLSLDESAVLRLDGLPDLHRDPFDRMLVCQAIDRKLTLVTPDSLIRAYPIPTLW